jgi:cytochrome c-type biogenesis protein CcmE
MTGKQIKFMILGSGVFLGMAVLLWAGLSRPGGMVYYHTVSEFMKLDERVTDGYRVNGKVVDGTIERFESGQDVLFVMSDGAEAMNVNYHGIVPDTFVDSADVVVEGRLGEDNVFVAHTLLAKCPSKYEAAQDGAMTASN